MTRRIYIFLFFLNSLVSYWQICFTLLQTGLSLVETSSPTASRGAGKYLDDKLYEIMMRAIKYIYIYILVCPVFRSFFQINGTLNFSGA